MLTTMMSRMWWVVLSRGLLAIIFGVVALSSPAMTLVAFVYIFAAYAVLDGIVNVFHAVSGRSENESWVVVLLEGLLGIVLGIIIFQAPAITTLVLLLYIGFWITASGVMRLIIAFRLRNEIEGEWWLVVSGIVSVLFGVAFISRPDAGALAAITFIGLWSIVAGVILVIFSFKIRSLANNVELLRTKLRERAF